jgi:hypothetical protein
MSATDDLTNRPGRDLTLGVDHHSRQQQCSPTGGSVISLQLNGQNPRQGHADRHPLGRKLDHAWHYDSAVSTITQEDSS